MPRTVRSRRPVVIGMSVTLAGVVGVASTRQTTGVLSCSPKSTAIGDAAVHDRARRRHGLPAVQVTQCDVVGSAGKALAGT